MSILQSIKEILKQQFHNIESSYSEIIKWNKIDISIFNDKNKMILMDSFIFRFIKIQDIIGDKFFKEVLKEIGEYKDNMSFIDIINKFEKLELINDAQKWKNYRTLRNNLTYDYPENQDELLNGIKEALIAYKEIELLYNNLINFLKSK